MERLKQVIYGLVFILISVGLLHADDLNNGFLGINWGTDISELKDMGKISKKGEVSYYKTSQKSYNIFGVDTASVTYGFYKDKFFAAYVAVGSTETFSRVKSHLTQKFGSPQTILKTQNQQTIYRWKPGNIRIKLKLYENEGRMKLSFYYGPLATEVNQAQREVFPQIPAGTFSLDEGSKREATRDRKLRQAIDVMGF